MISCFTCFLSSSSSGVWHKRRPSIGEDKPALKRIYYTQCQRRQSEKLRESGICFPGLHLHVSIPPTALFSQLLMGYWTKDGSWPENRKSCANVFICMLDVVALSIFVYTTKRLFFFFFSSFLRIWTPQGAAMLVHSLPAKSRKGQWFLMTWCIGFFFFFTAHASLVCSFIEMQTGRHETAALMVLFSQLSKFGC